MKVVFLDKDGHIFAFFPEDIQNSQGHKLSYAKVGQHSACADDYALSSEQAEGEAYQALKEEVFRIYSEDDPIVLEEVMLKNITEYVCSDCGSNNVEGKAWVNLNTDEKSWIGEYFCNGCSDDQIRITKRFICILAEYEYSVSTNTIWTSFDHGIVLATTHEDAVEKAAKKLEEDFEKVNAALKHLDNTNSMCVDFAKDQIQVTKK